MKFTASQSELARGLSVVSRAVSTKSTLPILSNVYLEAVDGKLKIAATNLEIFIATEIDAFVLEEGSITVPAKLFSDLVVSLPNETIDVSTDKRFAIAVKCAKSKASIKGLDAADYPPIPTKDKGITVVFDADTLKSAINQVRVAAATEESRPALAGVLFSVENKVLTLASTDGFRLAFKEMPAEAEDVSVIIPAKALVEVSRLADKGEITVVISSGNVLFHMEKIDVASRLIEGNYPKYKSIIPKDTTTTTVVEVKDFLDAVHRASLFARESVGVLFLTITDGNLSVTANTTLVGSNENDIDVEKTGEDIVISLSASYLSEALSSLSGKMVFLTKTPMSPCIIKNFDDESFMHIIMPLTGVKQ